MQLIRPKFVYDFPLTLLDPSQVIYLVLHHAAAKKATPEQIHEWHRAKGFGGFGYNEYVRKDGSVVLGRERYQGAHCKNYNAIAYGICAEGNYDEEQSMPIAQQESLQARIANALQAYPKIRAIKKHADLRATSCPGRYFPFERLERTERKADDALRLSAIRLLSEKGIVHDPQYWEQRALEGGSVRGDHAAVLIERMAAYIRGTSE